MMTNDVEDALVELVEYRTNKEDKIIMELTAMSIVKANAMKEVIASIGCAREQVALRTAQEQSMKLLHGRCATDMVRNAAQIQVYEIYMTSGPTHFFAKQVGGGRPMAADLSHFTKSWSKNNFLTGSYSLLDTQWAGA